MIAIVSGLPRSGTSLMMQMLVAGGMLPLIDFERKPDDDNPRGYFEWEPAKLLPKYPERIDEAEGKVVKVISQLLLSIPEGRDYRVIFMQRRLPELLASQDAMLRRRGNSDLVSDDLMASAFEEHLTEVSAWLKKRMDVRVLPLRYKQVLHNPAGNSEKIKDFLALNLDVEAMVRQVDLSLYRHRSA